VAILELTSAAQLHTDHPEAFFLELVDVIDHFAHIVGVIGVFVRRPVHARPVVIDADESHVEPVGTGHLTQCWQSMHGGAMRADDLPLLRFKDAVLPAFRGLRPVGCVLPVQQHDVKVFRLRGAPQFIELRLRIYALVKRRDLAHQAVAVTWQALQRFAQHARRLVRLGGLEEADAVVIRIVNEPRELLLSQSGLH